MFMNKHTNRYHIIHDGAKTIAEAKFAGKTVRGYAKRHPDDVDNAKIGDNLATLRCAEKINKKRVRNANKKLECSKAALDKALTEYVRMSIYAGDAEDEGKEIAKAMATLLKSVR